MWGGAGVFDRQPDGTRGPAAMELVRVGFPRRVYTQGNVDYVAEVVLYVKGVWERMRGVRTVEEPPVLRHFSARFEPAHGALIVD